MLLLIKTYGAYHAVIVQVLLSIWYLKYQILSKQEVFEKYLNPKMTHIFGILLKYHFMSICYSTDLQQY